MNRPTPSTHNTGSEPVGTPVSYEAELAALYASASIGLALLTRDLVYMRVNAALAAINGRPPEDHIGRHVSEIVPDLEPAARRMMDRLVATRLPLGPFDIEGETPARPSEQRVWTETWMPVFDETGEVRAASIVVQEVTEARRAEAERESRAAEVRRILDGVNAFAGRLDPDGTLTEANRHAIEAAGLAREDVIGKPFWDCYWWNFSEASRMQLKAAVARAARGEAQRYDAEVRVAGGRRLVIDFQLFPEKDADGRVREIIPSAVDITERKRAEEALRESLERLRTILTAAQVGIAIGHADGRVTEANGTFLAMIGRTGEDLVAGRIDWRQHLSVEVRGAWRRILRAGTLGPIEVIATSPAGRIVPTLSSAALLDPATREIVGFFIDRTRQKADEEHRELLLLELKHRVKNMLAAVQAIAKQTARHEPDRDRFVEALSGRLHAMARAHDLVTERAAGRVCLIDLIRAQVEPYVGHPDQLVCKGPPLELDPETAGALGLVLHELATNAAKYGALGTGSGRVGIDWAMIGPERTEIRWTETGGPPVAPPGHRGFGTTLIETSLGHALGGDVKLDYAPGGLCARMQVTAWEKRYNE